MVPATVIAQLYSLRCGTKENGWGNWSVIEAASMTAVIVARARPRIEY